MTHNQIDLSKCNNPFLFHFYYFTIYDIFRSGYEHAAKSFDKAALDVDVSSQAFLITGANSGIGKSAALAVAQRGKFKGTTSLKRVIYITLEYIKSHPKSTDV